MSYRINLYGYRRDKMRGLLGSRDTAAISRLHAKVDAENAYPDESTRTACKEILTRAITSGVPFPDLDSESHIHTWAATLLAHDEQKWLYTYCSYHREAVRAFQSRTCDLVHPELRAYITVLNESSPMFGQQFADDWSPYYASISLPRVKRFHDGLLELQDALPSPEPGDGEGKGLVSFLEDLIDYLGKIKDAEMDCWFVTG